MRRALSITQVNPGPLYGCGKRTFKRAACGLWQQELFFSGLKSAPKRFSQERPNGGFLVSSVKPSDPWIHGDGQVNLSPRRQPTPSLPYCAGPGSVSPRHAGSPDVTIVYKESEKDPKRADATRTGYFSPDCDVMTMSDGSMITRAGSVAPRALPSSLAASDGCVAATLRYRGTGAAAGSDLRPGWWQRNVTYGVPPPNATAQQGDVLLVKVTLDVDPRNSSVRMRATLSALADLPFCLGGVSLLNLTVPHGKDWDTQPALTRAHTGIWGTESVLRHRERMSSYFLSLKWGVRIPYLFPREPNTPFWLGQSRTVFFKKQKNRAPLPAPQLEPKILEPRL